jgi:hypothetical protein
MKVEMGWQCGLGTPRTLLAINEVNVFIRHTDPPIRGVQVANGNAYFGYYKPTTGGSSFAIWPVFKCLEGDSYTP